MIEALGSPLVLPFDPSRGIAPGNGRVLYVSGLAGTHASDDNEGTDPQFPLATITEALTRCAQRRHDYIFVQDFYNVDTFPILLAVRDVHLIGLGNGIPMNNRCLVEGGGAACFSIGREADGFEIAGFEMGSTGATNPCILVLPAGCWKNHIHHNAFGHLIPCKDGIFAEGAGPEVGSCIVDHNIFGTQIGRNGVNITNSTWSMYNYNFFSKIAGICIRLAMGQLYGILGNVFFSPVAEDLDAGWAIDLLAEVYNGIVAGNKASAAGRRTPGENNPYRDRTAAHVDTMLNGWSDNFWGDSLCAGPAPA